MAQITRRERAGHVSAGATGRENRSARRTAGRGARARPMKNLTSTTHGLRPRAADDRRGGGGAGRLAGILPALLLLAAGAAPAGAQPLPRALDVTPARTNSTPPPATLPRAPHVTQAAGIAHPATPLAWTRDHGDGRVHAAPGRGEAVRRNDGFRRLLVNGVVWAAGGRGGQSGGGWRALFDGTSTAAWRGFRRADLPDGWQVVDGALARVGAGGDIVTVDRFENFELRFEWQVEEGGNSGVFFGVTEEGEGPVWHSGPEFQILHNAGHPDGEAPVTSAGSNFAVHPPAADVTRPAGEWNTSRLIVDDGRVEHWMNGVHLLTYRLGDADWRARVEASKFAALPRYGRVRRGHVAIQDHGDPVRFRNVLIRELD